jgi:exopolysaccharide biosynthesis polyprenyl glycosylphosphotransferase
MSLMRKDLPNQYLLFLDLCCILISFLSTTWIKYGNITSNWRENIYGFSCIIVLLFYMAIYYVYDSYSGLYKRGMIEEFIVVFKVNCILAVTLTSVMYLLKAGNTFSRLFFISFLSFNLIIMYIGRLYFKIISMALYKKRAMSHKIMVVTTSDQVREVIKRLKYNMDWSYDIAYLTIIDSCMINQQFDGIKVMADYRTMFQIAKTMVLDSVFIHIPDNRELYMNLDETIQEFEDMGVIVHLSINTFGLKINEKVVEQISCYHVLTFRTKLFTVTELHMKRVLDIIGALVGSLLTIICSIFIIPAIIIESPGPILFSQIRVGKNGRRFKIYKFRSMFMDAEESKEQLRAQNEMNGLVFKMTNDRGITKVGKFLRRTSLDELPQFYNILKGDMSLVGTRPPTEDEFLQYEGRHKRRLALKSGLMGLWQISGRSDINDFEEVVKLDLEYIDNWSIGLDIKIILKTIKVVFFGKGSR